MSGPWGGRRVMKLRQQLAQLLPVPCARCGKPVLPGMKWDLGHVVEIDRDPEGMWDPSLIRIEHAHCNRAAGARYSNRKRAGRRRIPPTSREW